MENIFEETFTFTKSLPNLEGQYLIKWAAGESSRYELINVFYRQKSFEFGVEWDGGFYISSWGGKHVSHINLSMVRGIAKI